MDQVEERLFMNVFCPAVPWLLAEGAGLLPTSFKLTNGVISLVSSPGWD